MLNWVCDNITHYNLNQNSQAVIKECGSQKGQGEKRCKSKVVAKKLNGCDGRLMANILIMTIQVNLHCLLHVSLGFGTKFTRIVVIKIIAINIPTQPFLGHYLGFLIFFTLAFRGLHSFLQLGCFGLDITSFCIASHKASHKQALVLPFNFFFSLLQELWNKISNCVYSTLSD